MSTVHATPTGHAPSAPPDPKAWFSRLAATMARRRRWVMLTWLVVVLAAAPLALTLTGALSGAGWDAKGSTAQEVRAELRADFPALGAENPVVVFRQRTPVTDDPAGLERLVADLADGPAVTSVVDPLEVPAEAGLVSRDGRTVLVPVGQEVSDDAERPERAGELGDYVAELDLPAGSSACSCPSTV